MELWRSFDRPRASALTEARAIDERLQRLQARVAEKVLHAVVPLDTAERAGLLALLDYARTVTVPALAERSGGVRRAAAWRLASCAAVIWGDDLVDAMIHAVAADPQREQLKYRDYELLLPVVQLQLLLALDQFVVQDLPAGPVVERLRALAQHSQEEVITCILPFESHLRADPAGVYARLDARSRGTYRKAVFILAQSWNCKPSNVAEQAVNLAHTAQCSSISGNKPSAHVGFYLLDAGRAELRRVLIGRHRAISLPTVSRMAQLVATTSFVALCAAAAAAQAYQITELSLPLGLVCALAWVLLAYDYLGKNVQWLIGWIIGHRSLVAIDYGGGLPTSCRTVVAVPCLLVDIKQIDAMLDAQSWNFIIVNDTNVSVALLTDFPDSVDGVDRDEERHLLAYCARRVEQFNQGYTRFGKEPLTLLYRARKYSQTQRAWIGEERKRGKLEELHRFIGGRNSSFECIAGNPAELRGARFILCLDEDSRLLRNALHTLVGTLDHPLNRAIVDPLRRRIIRGHGLLVPAVHTRVAAVGHWRLGSIVTGSQYDEHDVPPEVREFHHDYLGVTPYPGKGLYEVAVYERVCAGRIPNGCILSHDTVEGVWLQPGFTGRAVLVEGFPSTHCRWRARQLRWIIGDWQNLWFLLSGVSRRRETPPMLWYMVLNQVQRSLTPVAIAILALVAMTESPTFSDLRLLAIAGLLFTSVMLNTAGFLVTEPGRWLRLERFRAAGHFVRQGLIAVSYRLLTSLTGGLIAVGYRLLTSLDGASLTARAIVTSAWRWTRRHNLLAWRAAALVEVETAASHRLLAGTSPTALLSALLLFGLVATGRASIGTIVILFGWSSTGWLFKLLARDPKAQPAAPSRAPG